MEICSNKISIPVSINNNTLVSIFTDNYFSNSIGDDVERHYHSFFELHYYLQGKGSVSIKNEIIDFEPNDLLVVAPNEYHYQQSKESIEIEKCVFKFSVSDFANKYDNILLPLIETISAKGYFSLKGNLEICDLIKNINLELAEKKKGYIIQISNLISNIFIILSRNYNSVSKIKENKIKKVKISTETSTIIDNFFDQKYNKNIKCEDLCLLVNLSRSQVCRIIKEMYKMSFKEKHIQTRINYIQHLLLKTHLSITQIAEKSGFDSISSLSNFFKRYVKISPNEYKKRNNIS